MAKNFVVFGLLLISSRIEAVEILTAGLPFVANYASSFNSHVVNHDIRTPVVPIQSAPLIQPATPVFNTYSFPNTIFARVTNPIPIAPQIIKTVNPVVQSQPITPNFEPNDERNESIEVEAAQRSGQAEGRSNLARLEDAQGEQRKNNSSPRNEDVTNPALLTAPFLARTNLKAAPTGVPNGFVFHSRVINEGEQFQQNQRLRIGRIQALPVQEKSKSELDNAEVVERGNLGREAGEKKEVQNVNGGVYSQLITF